MSLKKVLGSEGLASRTFEPVNLKDLFSVTTSGLLAGLLLPDTTSHKNIKHQGDGAWKFVGSAVVALNVLITHVVIVMIEDSIGSLALGISVRRRFLNVDSVSTIYVVRQHTFLMVWNFVIKQQSLGTELDGRNIVTTNVEQVALLEVSKFAILLWTDEVRS